jgi:hypothetical protein
MTVLGVLLIGSRPLIRDLRMAKYCTAESVNKAQFLTAVLRCPPDQWT